MKNKSVKNCINVGGLIQLPDSITERDIDGLMDLILEWTEERKGQCSLYYKPTSFEDWAMEDID